MQLNITTDKKYIVSGIIILVFVVIIIKLFYIQVVDSRYKFSANNNVLRYITQYPARGLIFDRNGDLLVANQVVYDLMIVKNQVKPFDTLEFASMLGFTAEQVKDAFEQVRKQKGYSPRKSVVLLKQISDSSYARLQEVLYKYQGFEVQPRTVRTYPRRIAGHLFGYVGEVDESVVKEQPYYQQGDYIGINGIEKYYEN
nr:penicillin-binding protein 2 [Tenuifilaceae bacterium]